MKLKKIQKILCIVYRYIHIYICSNHLETFIGIINTKFRRLVTSRDKEVKRIQWVSTVSVMFPKQNKTNKIPHSKRKRREDKISIH